MMYRQVREDHYGFQGADLHYDDRGHYADPSSLIRAMGQMMAHIGYADRNELLEKALEICTVTERKVVLTTQIEDASTKEYTDYLLETIRKLEA